MGTLIVRTSKICIKHQTNIMLITVLIMQCLEELLEGKISQLDLISKTKKNEKRFYHLYEGGNPQTP